MDVEKRHATEAGRCGKRMSKSKWLNHLRLGGLLELELLEMHVAVAGSTFRSQNAKSTTGLDHFWILLDGPTFQKGCRRGTFEEDLQRCILRGKHRARDISIRHVKRSGR